jgi:hypothetical protein
VVERARWISPKLPLRFAFLGMAVLDVRAALSHGDETEAFQKAANFSGFKNGNGTHDQATATFCVPTNSASSCGSPSSSSMAITSRRLALSSSSVSACECAPLNPGTYPTSNPVVGSRSTTAVKVFMPLFFHAAANSQCNRLSHALNNSPKGLV